MSKNQMPPAPLSRFGVLVAQLESIVASAAHKSPEPLLCFDLLSDLISAIDEDTKDNILVWQRRCEDALYSLLVIGARKPVRHLASVAMAMIISKGDGISVYSRASSLQGFLSDGKKSEPQKIAGSWVRHKLLILYATQTGNALDAAERLAREAERRVCPTNLLSLDHYDPSLLPQEEAVIFVVSTTGQGDTPDSMKVFWKYLLQRNLSQHWLKGVLYAVFGLGDSGYQKYNFVAKKLDKRLTDLGGTAILERGLGDDQHPSGSGSGRGRAFDMRNDREKPRGRGGGGGRSGSGKDKIDALGRLLTRILRHMASELNLNMRSDGYVNVKDLLNLNLKTFANIPLRSHTIDDVREAVETESLLKPILSAEEAPVCVHGTYKRNLESILTSGLKRMKRLHVHFSRGLPTDGEVISGMRRDVNVLIFLDVRKALEEGVKLYISDNKVILTEGFDGVVPLKYFQKIESWPGRQPIPF